MTTFTCWHGEEHDRYDATEVEARTPDAAAHEFALRSDNGDDSDVVYVLVADEGLVHEFKCKFRREVSCSAHRVATYTAEEV